MVHRVNDMKKVKVISGNTFKELEERINNFIKDKNEVEIKYQCVTAPSELNENGFVCQTHIIGNAMVVYEEQKMQNNRAIQMIDEYLSEPNNINKEWIECLLLCKNALLKTERKEE